MKFEKPGGKLLSRGTGQGRPLLIETDEADFIH